MMPPEGGGGGGGGVRQGGIDLLLLHRDTIQMLSDTPPPPPLSLSLSLSLSKSPFPPLKSVFSLISLIWEKQPDSLPQSPGWACLLPQAPKSVFSLIFDFRQTKFIAFLAVFKNVYTCIWLLSKARKCQSIVTMPMLVSVF